MKPLNSLVVVGVAFGFVAREDAGALAAQCLARHAWLREFNASQASALAGRREMRAVVVRPHPLAGVGNRMRVMRAALLLAAQHGALVVFEKDDLSRRLRPRLVKWDASAWPAGARRRFESLPRRRLGRKEAVPAALFRGPGVVILDAWNDDPIGGDEACAAVALFRKSATFDRELEDRPRAAVALHVRTNKEFDPAYVATRLAGRTRRGRPRLEACDTCWEEVASVFGACARAMGGGGTWFLASDDHDLVDAVRGAVEANFSAETRFLPRSARAHSGLARPNSSTAGPLLDLFLVARARVFVGTAGSSFSAQAVAVGGLQALGGERDALRRGAAVLFRSPFLKGPDLSDPSAHELPATPDLAARACRHLHELTMRRRRPSQLGARGGYRA